MVLALVRFRCQLLPLTFKKGLLVPVLTDYELIDEWDVYIYRPQSGPVPPRVRIVFDALVEHFQNPEFMPVRIPDLLV